MNKALVAVAAAGAFTGAAYAQSSVTLYGIVDAALQVTNYDRAGLSNVTGVNSGHRNASRWGLRGSEDLGGGLAAIFQLESGFFVDTGALGQGGRIFGRQAYVGFNNGLGTVALGRISTFDGGAFDMFTEIDPFIAGYGVASLLNTFSLAGGLRVDNAVLYRTPKIGGFQGGWIHSFNANGPEGIGTNTRLDNLGANFRAGPFYGAITYSIARFPDATSLSDQKTLYLGATYDLKVVKLHGAYANEKGARSALISAVGATADGTDANAWMIGASIPFGPNNSKFLASFQKRAGKSQTIGANTFNADRKVYGLGYEYFFSRRTIVHLSHARSDGSNTLEVGRAATDFANRKEYTLGITHFF